MTVLKIWVFTSSASSQFQFIYDEIKQIIYNGQLSFYFKKKKETMTLCILAKLI